MPEVLPRTEDNLEKTRAELSALKRENDLKDEKHRDPHWKYINPDELRKEEAEIWNSFQSARSRADMEALMRKFEDYRTGVMAELNKEKVNQPYLDIQKSHRVAMMAWLANKIQTKVKLLYEKENHKRG